ncbi:ATP-grasp domain-containing protein [Xenorhabdus griffiniae]|uniref:ATP-grasp domain-containing protein n=1 Tax=Xenorhabdus griffiniae TaxID=351672 RepID=UPI002359E549|nr:ATP-grasp domain-containing protein [Xenorhabdus griffiniae]MDC9606776.1 ATP-grasp domain-containing protein [Xenorhabdus griffiniae]
MQISLEQNTMNKILFIETRGMNPTGILKTTIELGYYPWVVTEQREEWQTHLNEQNINCTLLSVSQLTAQHILNVLPHRPKAVITLSDQYLEIGAEVAKYLDLPHTPLEVLADCRNKYITRKRVSRTTVKQPNFVKVDNLRQLKSISLADTVTFPLIFKPLLGHSSLGIHIFFHQAEVDHFFEESSDCFYFPYIIEQFIENAEFVSVEGFVDREGIHFLGCSSRLLGGENGCVELGGIFPYKLFETQLYDASRAVIPAINMLFGAFHIEYLVHEDNIYLVEINPRFPNGPAPANMSKALGIDLDSLIIEFFIQGFSKTRPIPTRFSMAKALYSTQDGIVTSIDFPDNFDADIFLSKTLPFTVSRIKSNTDRFGFLIVASDDLSLLDKKMNNIIAKMNVAILPSQE